MIEKTTIRTTGVVLLGVANVVLIFSMLFSMYTGGRPNSGSGVGVLCVSSQEARFPESEYLSVFSGLGLESYFLRADSSDEDQLIRKIQSFARREELDHVILVSYGDTAGIALNTAGREPLIENLILLMPRELLTEKPDSTLRQGSTDSIAIFDSEQPDSITLFELLSGEDALLSQALKAPGLFSSSVRIAPDAKTYMSLGKLTGDPVLDELIYPGLPDVQSKIAKYISNYVLADKAEISDVRGMILVNQILKIAPLAMLSAGLFFFLSTLSKPHSIKGVVPKEPVKESVAPKELSLYSKIERSEKYLFALLVPISVAYGVVLCVLMIAVPHFAAIAAAIWPVAALCLAALFYLKHIRKMAAPEKVNRARFLLSLLVSSLFVLGVFLMASLHLVSFRYFVEFPRVLLFAIPAALLIVCLTACQKVDMFYTENERTTEHRRGFLSAWRFRGILLVPFIAMWVAAFLTMKAWLFLLALFFIVLLIGTDWFRQRVKRMSGTLLLPAVMASVLYVLLAFI
ncbi:MAG: hypothetical protein PHP22_00540 [Oscillospiraceae bacterium]|nr:hypothetical protein [Clostridiales bacterium]MDD4094718.1 hypothetical protein [Oscillospiraceae bacterium]